MDKGNIVGLAGVIATKAEKHQALYGQTDLYSAYLSITRESGAKDTVLLIFKEDTINIDTMEGALPFMDAGEKAALLEPGQQVIITGKLQTYKNYNTGHITVFVWVDYIAQDDNVPQQNGVCLAGEVGRPPVYRTTPRGLQVTDIILKTPSAFAEGYYSYIPVICWGRAAKEVGTWEEGTAMVLEGRLQSREYLKRYEDHEEILTAYEVSASKVERIQQNG